MLVDMRAILLTLTLINLSATAASLEERAADLLTAKPDSGSARRLAEAIKTNDKDADSILLLAMIVEAHAGDAPEALKRVGQMYSQAITLLEHQRAERPQDFATALELGSRLLDRVHLTEQAKALRARSLEVRRQLIVQMQPPDAPLAEPSKVLDKNTKAPGLKSKTEPSYTNVARLARIQGSVALRIVVNTDGKPVGLQLVRSLGLGLDEAAVAAVRQWRFRPGEAKGKPVPIQATIEVNFRLL